MWNDSGQVILGQSDVVCLNTGIRTAGTNEEAHSLVLNARLCSAGGLRRRAQHHQGDRDLLPEIGAPALAGDPHHRFRAPSDGGRQAGTEPRIRGPKRRQ